MSRVQVPLLTLGADAASVESCTHPVRAGLDLGTLAMPSIHRPPDRWWCDSAFALSIDAMDAHELTYLLEVQDGVISRRQLLELGAVQHDIDRMLRRRDLTRVHAGVYVNHTGPLTWVQRAWSAVLYYWPAALTQLSALPKPPEAAHIHVAVDVRRSVAVDSWGAGAPEGGLRVEGGLAEEPAEDRGQRRRPWTRPPRLPMTWPRSTCWPTCASRGSRLRPSSARLWMAESRLPRGVWLRRIIEDLAEGACSVLEHGYLTKVERRHGLPRGDRQVRGSTAGRRAWRDVTYPACRTIVELDGRPFHDTARLRDKDFDRDLDASVDEKSLTVRLTYGQVFGTPCRTAARIGQLLQSRGWSGSTRRCPDCR